MGTILGDVVVPILCGLVGGFAAQKVHSGWMSWQMRRQADRWARDLIARGD